MCPWLCLPVTKCCSLVALLRACGLHCSRYFYLHRFWHLPHFMHAGLPALPASMGGWWTEQPPGMLSAKCRCRSCLWGGDGCWGSLPSSGRSGRYQTPSAKEGFGATAACEAELALSSLGGLVWSGGLETCFCRGKALAGTIHSRQNLVSALTSVEAGEGSPKSCFCCSLWNRKQHLY